MIITGDFLALITELAGLVTRCLYKSPNGDVLITQFVELSYIRFIITNTMKNTEMVS